jgi:hypothetical protein
LIVIQVRGEAVKNSKQHCLDPSGRLVLIDYGDWV